MAEKENIQEEHKSKVGNFWVWCIPAAVLFYFLSSGPAILLIDKVEHKSEWMAKAIVFFYYPLVLIAKHNIPILSDILKTYIMFWIELAGGL